MNTSVTRSKWIALLPYLGVASCALPFAAFLIKPANYSIMAPAEPALAGPTVALRVAQALYWAAGPLGAAAALVLLIALLRSEGRKAPLVSGLLLALGGLSLWLWMTFFLDAG
jgi:hypothetical protein